MAANIRGILLAAGSAKRFGSNKLLHALPPGTPDAGVPVIRPETIRIVTKALQEGAAIAAPSFHGGRGHPVGFARRFYEELSSLRGEDGARQFLKRHPEWVKLLEVDDPGVVRDIDEPSDLER